MAAGSALDLVRSRHGIEDQAPWGGPRSLTAQERPSSKRSNGRSLRTWSSWPSTFSTDAIVAAGYTNDGASQIPQSVDTEHASGSCVLAPSQWCRYARGVVANATATKRHRRLNALRRAMGQGRRRKYQPLRKPINIIFWSQRKGSNWRRTRQMARLSTSAWKCRSTSYLFGG